jgi:hypothetical protein
LIIDDGVPSRGHRANIFNPSWRVHGCFTGYHKVYNTQTVQDFTGGIYAIGAQDPAKQTMEGFMKEEVHFTEADGIPKDGTYSSLSTKVQASMSGGKVTKTVTRTYTLHSGGTKVVTKVVTL